MKFEIKDVQEATSEIADGDVVPRVGETLGVQSDSGIKQYEVLSVGYVVKSTDSPPPQGSWSRVVLEVKPQ